MGLSCSRPVRLYTHRREDTEVRSVLSHSFLMFRHTHNHRNTHALAWGGLKFKLLSCHQALIDGSFSLGCFMISSYWLCNFSMASFEREGTMICCNTEVQFLIHIDYCCSTLKMMCHFLYIHVSSLYMHKSRDWCYWLACATLAVLPELKCVSVGLNDNDFTTKVSINMQNRLLDR